MERKSKQSEENRVFDILNLLWIYACFDFIFTSHFVHSENIYLYISRKESWVAYTRAVNIQGKGRIDILYFSV